MARRVITGPRARCVVAAAMVLGGGALTGCSSTGSPTPAVSSGAGVVQSALSAAASAVASAQAAASSALASVKGGLDAKGDVTLGAVTTGSDGRSDVPVTVTNHQSQPYRYMVQVNFTDRSGNVLDTVVVNVPDVAAGSTATATARSNRSLSGQVTASVASALRY